MPVKGFCACIPRVACDCDDKRGGGNPINRIPGGKLFSPLPLISLTLCRSLELL